MERVHHEVGVLTEYTRAPQHTPQTVETTPDDSHLRESPYDATNNAPYPPHHSFGGWHHQVHPFASNDFQSNQLNDQQPYVLHLPPWGVTEVTEVARPVLNLNSVGSFNSTETDITEMSMSPFLPWISDVGSQSDGFDDLPPIRIVDNDDPTLIPGFLDPTHGSSRGHARNRRQPEATTGDAGLFEANLERVAYEIFGLEQNQVNQVDGQMNLLPGENQNVRGVEENSSGSWSYCSARSSLSQESEIVGADTGSWLWAPPCGGRESLSSLSERSSWDGSGSEADFADVESSDKTAEIKQHVKFWKKPSLLRNYKTELETIFSPSVDASKEKKSKDKENVKEAEVSSEDALKSKSSSGVPESGCTDSETDWKKSSSSSEGGGIRCSSGYFDSSEAEICVEVSSLNPNCQPFVPRAHLSILSDSGFHNATNLTQSTTMRSPEKSFANMTNNEMANVEFKADCSVMDVVEYLDVQKLHEDVAAELLNPPYMCPVNHREDFVPMQLLTMEDLPTECRSAAIYEAISSISLRVVRLTVKRSQDLSAILRSSMTLSGVDKNLLTNDYEAFGDVTDHLATGFVQHIDKDFVKIRTHSAVLRNGDDAAETKVRFSMVFPRRLGNIEIECRGEKENFLTNPHSASSIFYCKTPSALLPYLHLFKDIPVLSRSSLFNDSSYFTDSSPDTSLDNEKALPNQKGLRPSVNSTAEEQSSSAADNYESRPDCVDDIVETEIQPTLHQLNSEDFEDDDNLIWALGFPMDLEENSSSDMFTEADTPLWVTEEFPLTEDFFFTPAENFKENPFEYCGVDEDVVYNAFMSATEPQQKAGDLQESSDRAKGNRATFGTLPSESSIWTDVSDCKTLGEELSLMEVLEKRLEQTQGSCSYTDEQVFGKCGTYTPFSSFAGDLLTQCSPLINDNSQQTSLSSPFEFEKLLHVQNNHREEYNRLYKTHTRWDLTEALDSDPEPEKSSTASITQEDPTNSVGDCAASFGRWASSATNAVSVDPVLSEYLDTWDRDLLNLDEQLNPLPEYQALENLVSSILKEEDSSMEPSGLVQSKAKPTKGGYSMIISHPHGGPKCLSIGKFSQHSHVGGDLYDTPTCMGSCGAPVIALDPVGGAVFVTPLVHAGTSTASGLPVGVGVASLL